MITSAPNVVADDQATTPATRTTPEVEAAPPAVTTPAATTPTSPEVETAPPVAPMATRRVVKIAIAFAVVLAVLLVLGILPRRSVQRQLTAEVASAAGALPIIAVSKAQRPTVANTVMLPGTMEALHEAALAVDKRAIDSINR